MTTIEVKKLVPEKSYVGFASGRYKVAGTHNEFGAHFIQIYDEPPSLHIDLLNSNDVEYLPENEVYYFLSKSNFTRRSDGYFYHPEYPKLRFTVSRYIDEEHVEEFLYDFEIYKRPYLFGTIGKKQWEQIIRSNSFLMGFNFTQSLIK